VVKEGEEKVTLEFSKELIANGNKERSIINIIC
jgi:hypothetical protein